MPDFNDEYRRQGLREVACICQHLMAGSINARGGIRRLCKLGFETGDIPLGAVRLHWSASGLSNDDTRLEKYIEQNKIVLDEACAALIDAIRIAGGIALGHALPRKQKKVFCFFFTKKKFRLFLIVRQKNAAGSGGGLIRLTAGRAPGGEAATPRYLTAVRHSQVRCHAAVS